MFYFSSGRLESYALHTFREKVGLFGYHFHLGLCVGAYPLELQLELFAELQVKDCQWDSLGRPVLTIFRDGELPKERT